MTRERPAFGASLGIRVLAWAAAALLAAVWVGPALGQTPAGEETFSSPGAAVSALVAAVRRDDVKALIAILGPHGRRIVSSGDRAEDAANRANFIAKYGQMHRLVREPDGTTTLYVGAENWPMPIPIAGAGHAWYFDTAAGERQILYRRIGRNEFSAIRVCEALVAAQKQYYAMHHVYAGRVFSHPGEHDGLYWKSARGEPESPIGPLVASAVSSGYAAGRKHGPTAYRGYIYHVLTSQGPSAPGGAKSYLEDGKLTGGFAFVAYPAKYRASGVMTFIVGDDGEIYQKDQGRQSRALGHALRVFDPDASWHPSVQPASVRSPGVQPPSDLTAK
jgi:Protein of unknown function (DUF2950)